MTLDDDVKRANSWFDSVDASEFLDIVSRIRDQLQTGQTRDYLDKKLEAIRHADPEERRRMCRNLMPYLDWYVAGS